MNKENQMILKLRERMANREEGFTLIELLVVMLIIGILAAIAIPTFFNQTQKAKDSSSKEMAHTAQVAMETFATDNGGSYTGVNAAALNSIDSSIQLPPAGTPPKPTLTNAAAVGASGWTLTITSPTNNTFTISKATGTGVLSYTCTIPSATSDKGGCPVTGGGTTGNWG
jgi:type IV pilus assembly protein PilA